MVNLNELEIQLHPEDEAVLKCLEDHLEEYFDDPFRIKAEINRVRDNFKLEEIRTQLTINRLKRTK